MKYKPMNERTVENTAGLSPMLLNPANALEKSMVFGLANTPPPAKDDKCVVSHWV